VNGRILEQTPMRAGIARRMVTSKQQAPHFYVQTDVSVDAIRQRLAQLNEARQEPKVTMTAVLIRACAAALRAHPGFNAVWTEEGLLLANDINVGVAIALDDGLVAPAILEADALEMEDIARALDDLVERGRSMRLRPAEMTEATFTLSNLGMFDVTAFTAIITPPQVATLATARPVQRWSTDHDTPVKRAYMTVTLSADHRAVDGRNAALFLATFKEVFEDVAW